jgi:hypothetical protein
MSPPNKNSVYFYGAKNISIILYQKGGTKHAELYRPYEIYKLKHDLEVNARTEQLLC